MTLSVTSVRTARFHVRGGTWDKQRIVEAMVSWHRETGTPPRSYDWAPDTGRAMRMLGAEPAKWELEHPRWPSTACVVQHHGSWSAALRAAGLPARIPARDMSRCERIEAAQRLRQEGWTVTRIADELQLAASTVRCYLHATPCPRCGEPMTTAYLRRGARTCQPCAAKKTKASAWTPDLLVTAFHRWVGETGAPPKRDDWAATPSRRHPRHPKWEREFPAWPSAAEVATHFGGWNNGLRAAGLALRLSPRWTRERVIAALSAWTEVHGRAPQPADWARAEPGVHPGRSTVQRMFSTWAAGLEAAGLN